MTREALTPAQAAARWLARDDLGQSPQREQFAAWLEESQENRDAWIQAQRMWDVFDDADDSDLIAAMARAARKAGPEPAAKPFWSRLVAASIAVAAVSATLFFGAQQGWFDHAAKPTQVAVNEAASLTAVGRADYVTGGEQRSIVDLPDGTRVTLDADSAVDVAFAGGRRDVRLLKGHAFFDVAHDSARPFAVQAAGRVVTALGTQFDVRLTSGALRVVLAEGSVLVSSPSEGPSSPPIRLSPGQAFSTQPGGEGEVTPANLDEALAWKQGVVEFRDQPLSEAVGLLNRYTRAQIVIRDPKVGALRITGVFKTGDIRRFGRSVSQVLPVRMIARDADTYELVSTRR
ncbi:FecR domain-containing protein [Caulobacter sp. BE254]|uniref:FecR family protein n=1 Tax=Caulobacter sp. BE254 TaxID=2817720 RepID=UPI00285C3C31|nr:FecR domain-containing protein [Caulobacter sp. BE254]MDR7114152.1 transmembrane sensor [Caulobacter sp. BE254]